VKTEKSRVLLIEDDVISQHSQKALLEDYGFSVDIAATATEGLDLLHEMAFQPFKKGYDVIFMDIGLPDINGDVLTEVIRQTEEAAKLIPIIAVTGRDISEEDKKLYMEMGITDIILKPMTRKLLEFVLSKYMQVE
jgi:DNA-binding response OmpR family regulator